MIAYLDDDNLMSDGWLRAVVEVLGRQHELRAVYGAQLREVDAAEPWLLLEPFDELRLLEGNFIDIGAFAHRPIGGVAHRPDIRGLEDWDFILSVGETHTPVALPVIASIYLTGAGGRMTLGSDQSDDEEFIRSSAVRSVWLTPSSSSEPFDRSWTTISCRTNRLTWSPVVTWRCC